MSDTDTTPADPPRQTVLAQEQADEYGGFARSATVIAHKTGEKFTVPSVLVLDDDQLIAYEKLHHLMNSCDRHPDVERPEQHFVNKAIDGSEVETKIGAHTQRGDYVQPYQKDGVLIEPPYSIQLALIYWGKEGYKRFKAGGGRSAEIPQALAELNQAIEERRSADPKSNGSAVDVDSVPQSDRG